MNGTRTPQRVQMSRQRPWRAEHPDAIRVDRATVFGNPFAIAGGGWRWWVVGFADSTLRTQDRAREAAVSLFRDWLSDDSWQIDNWPKPDLAPLRGHDLACWCPPSSPCHADVLLEIANGGEA